MPETREVVVRRLNSLREHPRQRALFGDFRDNELEALAADMEKNGLQHPVEILRDGTIIAGHQRVRAAKRLKWKTIEVIIRRDLEEAGERAVEAYLIRDNLVRRQLSPLGKARCIQSLLELESGRQASRFGWKERDKLKAQVGQQLGMTARNINR
jgi:ParB family transcriptional regulator, chromosome partitioning protein